MTNWEPVNKLMEEAVANKIFPGGVLLVAAADSVVFFEAYGYADIFAKHPIDKETVFDLASLTKPLATTLAVMQLVSQHKLRLDQDLGSVLPLPYNSEKSRITLKQLLCHTSGLCDYRPYYESLDKLPRNRRKDALREFLVSEPLINPPGAKVLYSDLGFMLLNWVVEQVAERRLDQFVKAEIYDRLGIEKLFFINLDSEPRNVQFAATELCPWRDTLINGVVHDENAYAVGGIEGHAGLFGTAKDVYRLLSVLLTDFYGQSESILFEKKLMQTFFIRDGSSGRPLGFDAPSSTGASCGQYFSKKSVGHLGFTGTSFWMDLDRGFIVILLTNRVHPSRDNVKIKAFRPRLHDMVMTLIGFHP